MMELRAGLIGIGKFGSNYLKTKVEGIRITHICSASQASLDKIDGSYTKTTDYRELINGPVDGVIIAAPTGLHYEMVSAAIAAHKPFVVEKPLTGHGDESQKILDIYNKNPVLALVNFVYLFDPCFQALKLNLSQIGKLQRIEFYGLQSSIRTDGITVIQDWGPHPLYIMQNLMGLPTKIEAKKLEADNIELNLSFTNGVGMAQIGWTHSTRERKIVVAGEKGKIVYDATQTPDQKLIIEKAGEHKPLLFEQTSALTNLLLHFTACLRDEQSPIASLALGAAIDKQIDHIHL